jgi:hypothetical protein
MKKSGSRLLAPFAAKRVSAAFSGGLIPTARTAMKRISSASRSGKNLEIKIYPAEEMELFHKLAQAFKVLGVPPVSLRFVIAWRKR